MMARGIRRYAEAIKENRIMKNVGLLAGGSTISQILGLLAIPVLARIYSREMFGILAVFTAIITIFNAFDSLSLEMAVPLPDREEDARNLVGIVLALLAGAALVAPMAVWALVHLGLIRYPSGWYWLGVLIPLGILGLGGIQVENYWLLRKKAFALTARAKMLQSFLAIGGQVLIGLLVPSAAGLVGSLVVAQVVCLVYLHGRGRVGWPAVSPRDACMLLTKYRKFPKYNMFCNLLGVLGVQLAPLALARFFSQTVAGDYAMAYRALGLPIMLIGQAASQVFFAEWASTRSSKEGQRKMLEWAIALLVSISIPVFLLLMLHGQWLFALLLGTRWAIAGTYSRILSVWFMCLLISSPLSPLLIVYERLGLALGLAVMETLLRVAVLAIGIRSGNPVVAIAGFAMAGVVISIVYVGVLLRQAKSSIRHILGLVWRPIAIGLVLLGTTGLAEWRGWMLPGTELGPLVRGLALAAACTFAGWSVFTGLRQFHRATRSRTGGFAGTAPSHG